jgi:hypothetical protein
MIPDYHGAVVLDAAGERIGTVERSYVDDCGTVKFVEVKIGGFRAKHRLIPSADAQSGHGGLAVPYTKDVIRASPDAASAGDTLEGELLEQVQAYYAGSRTSGDVATSTTAAPAEDAGRRSGGVRDRGDVIEIPIVEEELVKRPVVKEVLRVRKDQVTEQQTVEANLRKEDVEIAQDGDAMARGKA